MYAFITTKAVAIGLATTAILGGGIAAEASGTTAMMTGRSNAHVAVQSGQEKALDALASLRVDAHAAAGLDRARAAIGLDHPNKRPEATLNVSSHATAGGQGDVGNGASIGTQVNAEARGHTGSLKEFVLNLLGVETGHRSQTSVAASTGTDTAINAVTDAQTKANAEADSGLSIALNAVTSAGSEASEGASSEANLNAQTVLEGQGASASGSATGSTGLRIGLSRTR